MKWILLLNLNNMIIYYSIIHGCNTTWQGLRSATLSGWGKVDSYAKCNVLVKCQLTRTRALPFQGVCHEQYIKLHEFHLIDHRILEQNHHVVPRLFTTWLSYVRTSLIIDISYVIHLHTRWHLYILLFPLYIQ